MSILLTTYSIPFKSNKKRQILFQIFDCDISDDEGYMMIV